MAASSDLPAMRPPAGCRHLPATDPTLAFADGCGLRALLERLHAAGEGAWRTDPEVELLLGFVAERYAGLARRHDQEAEDAAAAAFEVLRADATRTADDPWAVLTVAVRLTLAAEERAQGLLTTARRVRRHGYAGFHDAERFSDRAGELADYHPALQHHDHEQQPDGHDELWVVAATVELMVSAGWPAGLAGSVVAYICERLGELGSRPAAYEALRRDKAIRARFDLSHDSWICALRSTLGHPSEPGPLGHGVLARLLAGDSLADLRADAHLTALITEGFPTGWEVR